MNKYREKNEERDRRTLLRNSFLWLYTVIWILFVFVFLFTSVFRVVSFPVQTDSGLCYASVIVLPQDDSLKTGDMVAAGRGASNWIGEVVACEGETISLGIGKAGTADCIIYQNKRYFSVEELSHIVKDGKIPKGCVLLKSGLADGETFRVRELVAVGEIAGAAVCVAYPFQLLGQSVQELKNL